MHELSIATNLVEIVIEAAEKASARRVIAIHLKLGALTSIAIDSLRFCFEIAAQNTLLAGSRLEVRTLPVVIHCRTCNKEVELASLQLFQCPECGQPGADIRQGRELEVESIEIEEASAV